MGDLFHDCDRRVSSAAFDVADIGAVDAGFVRERLLAPAFGVTKTTQVSAEAGADIHAAVETRLSPIDLQTIRDIRVDCPNTQSMGMSLIDDRNTP